MISDWVPVTIHNLLISAPLNDAHVTGLLVTVTSIIYLYSWVPVNLYAPVSCVPATLTSVTSWAPVNWAPANSPSLSSSG